MPSSNRFFPPRMDGNPADRQIDFDEAFGIGDGHGGTLREIAVRFDKKRCVIDSGSATGEPNPLERAVITADSPQDAPARNAARNEQLRGRHE